MLAQIRVDDGAGLGRHVAVLGAEILGELALLQGVVELVLLVARQLHGLGVGLLVADRRLEVDVVGQHPRREAFGLLRALARHLEGLGLVEERQDVAVVREAHARISIVTGCLRLRSMWTNSMSLMSVLNSTQLPR